MAKLRSESTETIMRKNLSMWNVTNYQVTNVPYYNATFTIPGLSHESFDNYGNAKITSIMMTSVMSRAFALQKPDVITGVAFLNWPSLTKDKDTVVTATEYLISNELYNPDVPKWPLDVKFSLGNVGQYSVSHVTEFYVHGDSKTHLWTNVTQIVAVDILTRHPIPLPDWFKNKYTGKGCMSSDFVIKTFTYPPVTFTHPFQVTWSDTDNHKHTNFTSYVEFTIDSVHAALRARRRNEILKEQQAAAKRRGEATKDYYSKLESPSTAGSRVSNDYASIGSRAENSSIGCRPTLEHYPPGSRSSIDHSSVARRSSPEQYSASNRPTSEHFTGGSRSFNEQYIPGGRPYNEQNIPGGRPYNEHNIPGGRPYNEQNIPGGRPYNEQNIPGGRPYNEQNIPGGRPYNEQNIPGGKPYNEQYPSVVRSYNEQYPPGNMPNSEQPIPHFDDFAIDVVPGITFEKIANGLKKVQICFLTESSEGQTLNTHIWQEVNEASGVFCSIKRDSVEICQVKLEYF